MRTVNYTPTAVSTWSRNLEDDSVPEHWYAGCTQEPKIGDTKLRSFHLTFLKRRYQCNNVRAKFMSTSDLCSFCKMEKETCCHLYCSCLRVQQAIQKLGQFLEEYLELNIEGYDKYSVLFSNFRSPVPLLFPFSSNDFCLTRRLQHLGRTKASFCSCLNSWLFCAIT